MSHATSLDTHWTLTGHSHVTVGARRELESAREGGASRGVNGESGALLRFSGVGARGGEGGVEPDEVTLATMVRTEEELQRVRSSRLRGIIASGYWALAWREFERLCAAGKDHPQSYLVMQARYPLLFKPHLRTPQVGKSCARFTSRKSCARAKVTKNHLAKSA